MSFIRRVQIGLDAVGMGELDGELQGVGALVQQRLHVVVRERALAFEKDVADLRVVREVVEGLGRAVEERVGLSVEHVLQADADEAFGRRRVGMPHVVAVVVEDDATPAMGEGLAVGRRPLRGGIARTRRHARHPEQAGPEGIGRRWSSLG